MALHVVSTRVHGERVTLGGARVGAGGRGGATGGRGVVRGRSGKELEERLSKFFDLKERERELNQILVLFFFWR